MFNTFGEILAEERIRIQALSYYIPDGESNMDSVEDSHWLKHQDK
jgi:hypothetical protein